MKVDLKDFTTVDSIGEIDDDLNESDTEIDITDLDDESMGLKFVKKVEALYCEICENYISHEFTNENEEETILKHCKTKIHLKLTRKNAEANVEEINQDETQLDQSEEMPEIKEECGEPHEGDLDIKNDDSVNDEEIVEKSAVENNEEDDEDDETVLNIDIIR